MGGLGSGRRDQASKYTDVEDCLVLAASDLRRRGVIRVGELSAGPLAMSGARYPGDGAYWCDAQEEMILEVTHTHAHTGLTGTTKIPLVIVPSSVGGSRLRFRCPVTGRAVDKLYLPPGVPLYASRQAHRLRYRAQRLSRLDREDKSARRVIRDTAGSARKRDARPSPERRAEDAVVASLLARLDRYGAVKRLAETRALLHAIEGLRRLHRLHRLPLPRKRWLQRVHRLLSEGGERFQGKANQLWKELFACMSLATDYLGADIRITTSRRRRVRMPGIVRAVDLQLKLLEAYVRFHPPGPDTVIQLPTPVGTRPRSTKPATN